jgi:hypothetical protein
MPLSNHISPEARRTGVWIGDPSLADTLEVLYLRSVLDGLPPEWRTAVDLGAGAGDVSAELLARGLRVLGIEPNPTLAASLRLRFGAESRERQFQLEMCAVEREGELSRMLDSHGFREIGVARVGAGNAQWSALNALIDRHRDLPAIVTFRAGGDSSDVARGCIGFLWAHGYGTFDVFIKRGADPVAAERFAGTELPAVWRYCAGRELTAGFIAYHATRAVDAGRVGPRRFLSDFQILKSQRLLRSAMKQEARVTYEDGAAKFVMDGLVASRMRSELRFDILTGGWAGFQIGRMGRHLGAKAPWGPRQERQRSALAASMFGRRLVGRLLEPPFGAVSAVSPGVPAGLSVPMTGALYNMMRLHEHSDGRLPRRVVELAGGWGLGAFVYASVFRDVTYAIVDYPEALAVQHYFLTLSLPGTEVKFAEAPNARPKAGTVLLAPTSWLRRSPAALACQLLYSSKSSDQLFPSIRSVVRHFRGFGASNTCFAGDWAFEGEEMTSPPRAIAA